MNKQNLSNRLLVSTMVLLGSFLVALASGVAFLSVGSSIAATADSPVDVALVIAPVISLTTDASNGMLNIPIAPTPAGTFGSNDLTVSVHTNNSTGYTLTMNSVGADTALAHTTLPTNTIPSTTATLAAPTALANNTWGYGKWTGGTTPTAYSRVPALASPDTLTTTTDKSGSADTKLSFGVKVDNAKPAGTYANTMVFSATANYVPKPIRDGMNMQDATAELCAGTPLGTTVNLKDARDNKYYRVRKMADNRCWMIDNLAYQLLQNDTGTTPNTGAPAYNPSAQVVSGTMASLNNRAQYAANPTFTIPNNGTPTQSYLYNWCAAMGDTSANCATTVGYDLEQPATPQTGICPAPFRLPIGGAEATTPSDGTNKATAAATTANEFARLDIWLGGSGVTNLWSSNTYTNFTTDNPVNPELFWSGVLSGLYINNMYNLGSYGYWWSSTAFSGANGFGLSLYAPATHLSYSNYKQYGFAVRCIL